MAQSSNSVAVNKIAWKNTKAVPGSMQPVYGAMHPPYTNSRPSTPKKEASRQKHKRTSSSSSFRDFQESTDDAWDMGDDDFYVVSDVKILPKVAQSTANDVIANHSEQSKANSASPQVKQLENSGNEGTESKLTRAVGIQRLAIQKGSPTHRSPPSMTPIFQGPGRGIRQVTSSPAHQKQSNSNLSERESARLQKFHSLLNGPHTDLDELRELSWPGIPSSVRAITWRLLAGYLPANVERRESTLERKRDEYFNYVRQYYDTRNEDIHQETYRQIHIDIPRMSPLVQIFQQPKVQEVFERILYIWAIRHPASGYVQGMNDLVTPFFIVFLQGVIPEDVDVENFDVSQLPVERLQEIEADSFWCMSKLLEGIQDNYTFAQPGIQSKVNMLKDLIQRIDSRLHDHLQRHCVEYLQFSFRWMNNLLMRELPLRCTIRLWDTCLAESDGFSSFHLYVCAAFLSHWSQELLRERDFQGLMLMLQNLPTLHWTDEEISLLVAEAYKLKYMFADAPNHLHPNKK